MSPENKEKLVSYLGRLSPRLWDYDKESDKIFEVSTVVSVDDAVVRLQEKIGLAIDSGCFLWQCFEEERKAGRVSGMRETLGVLLGRRAGEIDESK